MPALSAFRPIPGLFFQCRRKKLRGKKPGGHSSFLCCFVSCLVLCLVVQLPCSRDVVFCVRTVAVSACDPAKQAHAEADNLLRYRPAAFTKELLFGGVSHGVDRDDRVERLGHKVTSLSPAALPSRDANTPVAQRSMRRSGFANSLAAAGCPQNHVSAAPFNVARLGPRGQRFAR